MCSHPCRAGNLRGRLICLTGTDAGPLGRDKQKGVGTMDRSTYSSGCWKFLAKEMSTPNCKRHFDRNEEARTQAVRNTCPKVCSCLCLPPMVFARRPARSVKLRMSLPVCETTCVWKMRDGYWQKIPRHISKPGRRWRNSLQICRPRLPTP